MHAYQWFLLGIMVAYTPSLIILAFTLRDMEVDADARPYHGEAKSTFKEARRL
jgi:hypothetical protein